MVLKNTTNVHNPEDILNCVFEVLANSMKIELDKLVKLSITQVEYAGFDEVRTNFALNAQRKQLLAYLLNVNETGELNQFIEHFVSVYEIATTNSLSLLFKIISA